MQTHIPIMALLIPLILSPHAGMSQITAGGTYWLVTPEGTAAIGIDGIQGTQIDVEDDLGYRDEEGVAGANILLGKTHQLGANFFHIDIAAENSVDQDIRYQDLIFPIRTEVRSSLEATVIRGFYRFKFGNDTGGGGLIIGGQYLNLRAEASAVEIGSATADVQAGMPVVGADLRINPFPYVCLKGSAVGIAWDFEDVEATFIDAEAAIILSMDPGLFVGGGYRHLVIDAKESSEPISADLSFSGPFAVAGFQW